MVPWSAAKEGCSKEALTYGVDMLCVHCGCPLWAPSLFSMGGPWCGLTTVGSVDLPTVPLNGFQGGMFPGKVIVSNQVDHFD